MYEKRFKTIEYDILTYATSRNDILSCEGCIELVSPIHLSFPKEFVLKENRIFCKLRIEGCSGRLKVVEIKRILRSCSGYAVLKKLIPSVFDINFIRKVNFQRYLYSYRNLIMRSSIRVLGRKVVDKINLWNRIKWHYGQNEGPEDDIEGISSDILMSDYWEK
ncbi:hypothetical protein J0A71_06g12730 [Encephalitozoon cuniculi]|nr:hypothetical protein J0A71_06g12730 [Encephalitozoon cuniculi]